MTGPVSEPNEVTEAGRSGENRAALRIALAYLVLAALWILASDRIVASLVTDPGTLTAIQTWKGWFFVVATSALLYVALGRELRRRRHAESVLVRTQKMTALLVEQVKDHAIFALDEQGRIASWNAGSTTTLGYSADAVLGRPVSILFAGTADGSDVFDAAAVQRAGHAMTEAWCVHQNESRIWVHASFTAILDPEGAHAGFSCVLRDLSERKRQDRSRAELLIREHAVRMQAEDSAAWATFLAESGEMLAGTLESGDPARTVVRLACERIADWAVVYQLDEGGGQTGRATHHRVESKREEARGLASHRIAPDSPHPVAQTVRNRKGIVIHALTPDRLRGLATDDRHFELLRSLGTRSVIIAPLLARGHAIGAIVLAQGDSGRVYGEGDVVRAQELAGRAALSIDNARLFREASDARAQAEAASAEVRRQLARMDALREIDRAITGSIDARVTLGVILDQVTTIVGVNAAAVQLFDPRTRVLRCAAARGFRTNEIADSRIELGEGTAGRAALERRSTRVRHPKPGAEPRRAEFLRREGIVDHAAIPLVAKGDLKGVLEVFHRSEMSGDSEWLTFLESLAGQAAVALDGAALFENLQKTNAELAVAYDRTLEGWSRALEFRDRDMRGHAERVTDLTVQLARTLGVRAAELPHIRRGALLHDIGKMALPDSILLKPGPLTDAEWIEMRRHPVLAYHLIAPIPFLRPALDIPLFHHEWWDGSGYPYGLAGDAIPVAARIFAVIDVWDSMQTRRPFREPTPPDDVIRHMRASAGSQLDPAIIDAFFAMKDRPRSA